MADTAHGNLPRRDFLVGICGLVGLGLGAALLADDALAADGITRLPDGRVEVEVAKVPGLARVGGAVLLGNIKGVPTAVVRTSSSAYRALDLRCTHQGVPVKKSGSQWFCPAHGSTFAMDGKVRRGPAIASLSTVRSRFAGGVLTVG